MTELVKKKSTNWLIAGTWWEFTGTLKKQGLDWIGLDCGNLDHIVLAQTCILYTHTLIAEVNRKINLLSWASMNTAYYNLGLSQGGILSFVSNESWSTKLIKYHGLKAFSCKQLNKLIILVVLLCPLYSTSIVYAIFKKHKIIKMAFVSICQHMHEQFIFFASTSWNQWR